MEDFRIETKWPSGIKDILTATKEKSGCIQLECIAYNNLANYNLAPSEARQLLAWLIEATGEELVDARKFRSEMAVQIELAGCHREHAKELAENATKEAVQNTLRGLQS